MKDGEFINLMAMLADSEARSTATLVEMVAATVLMKTRPPVAGAVVSVQITQADMDDLMRDFHFESRYENNAMTIHLTPLGTELPT